MFMTITSHHNQALKEIRKLRQRKRWRERSGRFVAEGEDLLAAADAAGWEPVARYCAAGSGLAGVEVEASVLASASGLASGTRALGVYEERWLAAPVGPLCVYLHGVADPGNVGAVLRSGQAFGASCVALGVGCADPYSPKAVRASMGAVFGVGLVKADDVEELPGLKIALVPDEGAPLAEVWQSSWQHANQNAKAPHDSTRPRAEAPPASLLIGAEREGLPAEVVQAADLTAHIPIATQSLNAAMAATVALYELTRMPRP